MELLLPGQQGSRAGHSSRPEECLVLYCTPSIIFRNSAREQQPQPMARPCLGAQHGCLAWGHCSPSKSMRPSLFLSESFIMSSMSSSVTGSPVALRISPSSSMSMNPSAFLQEGEGGMGPHLSPQTGWATLPPGSPVKDAEAVGQLLLRFSFGILFHLAHHHDQKLLEVDGAAACGEEAKHGSGCLPRVQYPPLPPATKDCSPSSSTSSMMASNSSLVGFWPSILITVPNSLVLMSPPPSASNMSKAALNSVERKVRSLCSGAEPGSAPWPCQVPVLAIPTLTRNHLLAEEGTGLCLLVRLQGKGEGSPCQPYQVRDPSHSTAQHGKSFSPGAGPSCAGMSHRPQQPLQF